MLRQEKSPFKQNPDDGGELKDHVSFPVCTCYLYIIENILMQKVSLAISKFSVR